MAFQKEAEEYKNVPASFPSLFHKEATKSVNTTSTNHEPII